MTSPGEPVTSAESGWRDRRNRPVAAPEPPAAGSHYPAIGAFQGAAYDRNAFTRGTAQEAGFLWEALELRAGSVVLDVGCGTGRHVRALAERGAHATGIDLSGELVAAAGSARVAQGDARALPVRDEACDAVLSVCQGGFGLTPEGDRAALAEMARVLRPGGRLALTAFSLVFAARWVGPDDALDVRRGLHWQPAEVRGPDGDRAPFDLWTTCYSPAHLAALTEGVGMTVETLSGVEPGAYSHAWPSLDDPEYLLLGMKP